MEIDVTYCKFARLNDVCASPINTQECKCSKISIQMCYYKQLQQLKAENEELKKEVNRHLKQQEVKDNYLIPKSKEYKQCLDEIKELCNENKYPNDEYDFVAFFANKILQKIKEVK